MAVAGADDRSDARFLSAQPVPPHGGSTDFSLHLWDQVKSFGISPEFGRVGDGTPAGRIEFLTGARLMGFELEEYDPEKRLRELTDPTIKNQERARRRAAGYFEQLLPQQLQISDTMDEDLAKQLFEISRRATKTTSIFLKLLGRCAVRPGHQVTFSAQNGVSGSRRLREWALRLDAQNPADDADLPPWMRGRPRQNKAHATQVALFGEEAFPQLDQRTSGRGFRIMRGEVGKGIYFDNSSQFLVLKPDADAYRGEGADDSWLDEFQEVEPVAGDELLAGILPLQDTKLGATTIVSGTAGEARVGPFWDWIDLLRKGSTSIGGLDFAAPEDTPQEVLDDESAAMELLKQKHPGIGTLTTVEKMLENYRTMPRPQWAREYLSIWPETFGALVIDPDQWAAAMIAKPVTRPARVAFGMAIKPRGGTACIAAAWRSSSGLAYIETVEHRLGTTWLPKVGQAITTKYRASTIGYDAIAEGAATATEMEILRPKPRLQPITYTEMAAGCIQILRDLERGTLRVPKADVSLNAAAQIIAKREVRSEQGMYLWTPAEPGGDITAFDAATRALRNWDRYFAPSQGGSFEPIMGD